MEAMPLGLQEHKRTEIPVSLEPEVRDHLAKAAGIEIQPAPGMAGSYYLKPSSWVGAVALGNRVIALIKPKIPISRLIFMLSYVLDSKHWESTPLPSNDSDDLVSAVVFAMAAHVETATRQGLLRGYVHVEDTAAVVRGRIRLDEQIRRWFGNAPPIAVEYDEFTENIHENLIPRAALRVMAHLPLPADARLRLRTALAPFRSVEVRRYQAQRIPTVNYTRLTEHYRPLVELSRFVLENSSFEFEKGSVVGSTFLVNMNTLFEDFVHAALRDRLAAISDIVLQHGLATKTLDLEGRVTLVPDLSVWDGSHPVWLGDLKYKEDNTKVSNDDLYQMVAYLVASDLSEGTLIYPKIGGSNPGYNIRHVGRRVMVESIDLSMSPKPLLEAIGLLGTRIAEAVNRRPAMSLG
jgi:5-methylcytosine-specific restriction enzyme subunit McrC